MKVKADRDESSPYAAMLAAQDVAAKCKVWVERCLLFCCIFCMSDGRLMGAVKSYACPFHPGTRNHWTSHLVAGDMWQQNQDTGAGRPIRALARSGLKIGRIGERYLNT